MVPTTAKTRLTRTGVTRQRRELPQIMQAWAQIPEGRLVQIAGKDDWLDLDLETSDIRIPGLDDVSMTVTPNVSFRVARRVIRRVALVADLQNVPPDREVTAIFQPVEIDVRGPAPYLFGPEALAQITVSMDARKQGPLVFKALSQELRDRGITLLHGAEFSCTLRSAPMAVAPETYQIPNVPIRLTHAALNEFEFEIASPLDKGIATVTLSGPPDAILRFKSGGADFASELEIVVLTAKAAEANRAKIETGTWFETNVQAHVLGLPADLDLKVELPRDVPMKMRLKP